MAVQNITYDNKVALNTNPGIADVNKVTDNDMNEIKSVVNNNANELSSLTNIIYPIGSIYINTTGTNPSTFLGGTWESFGSGKVLVGQDTNDSDFDTLLETGGNKTHQHGYQQATTVNPAAGDGVIGRANYTADGSSLQPYIVVSIWKRTA